jgi:hypothetical protein
MSPARRFVLCLSLFGGTFSCAYLPGLEARVPLPQEGWHELYAACCPGAAVEAMGTTIMKGESVSEE